MNPLIAEIVHGEDGPHAAERAVKGLVGAHEAHRPRRLMIVRVKDVEALAEQLEGFDRGTREEQEALTVVAVAGAGSRVIVDPGAVEEPPLSGMPHEQDARPLRGRLAQHESGRLVAHSPRNLAAPHRPPGPALGELDGRVAGNHHRHPVAAARLLDREGADDVPQAPHLDEGRHLACDMSDRKALAAHPPTRGAVTPRPRSPAGTGPHPREAWG